MGFLLQLASVANIVFYKRKIGHGFEVVTDEVITALSM
jgi:hypothetical protein